MSQLQTFRVERVSNMSYFNIMKRKRFKNLTVETTQHWQTSDQRHLCLAQENKDNS